METDTSSGVTIRAIEIGTKSDRTLAIPADLAFSTRDIAHGGLHVPNQGSIRFLQVANCVLVSIAYRKGCVPSARGVNSWPLEGELRLSRAQHRPRFGSVLLDLGAIQKRNSIEMSPGDCLRVSMIDADMMPRCFFFEIVSGHRNAVRAVYY